MWVLDNGIFYSMDTSLQHGHQFTAWAPVYSMDTSLQHGHQFTADDFVLQAGIEGVCWLIFVLECFM